MKRLNASVAPLVVAVLSSAPNSHANPIIYDISGLASGEIGATTFTNASVELTGIGDTANVTSLFSGTIFGNPFNTFKVTIGASELQQSLTRRRFGRFQRQQVWRRFQLLLSAGWISHPPWTRLPGLGLLAAIH